MARNVIRFAVIGALCAAASAVPVLAASAAPGRGTFTQITTPTSPRTYHFVLGATNTLQVSGATSLDVTQVDIDCVTFVAGQPADVTSLAPAVPVTSGSFTATATFGTSPPANCRLRAVPLGVDPTTDYLGAYTGPILYVDAFGTTKDASSIVYSFQGFAEEGDGLAVVTDVGSCGTEILVTVDAPQMLGGPTVVTCLFELPGQNLDPSATSTQSSIRVDGHNAYLPSSVHSFLIGAQTALTVSRQIAHNGDVTFTESALLVRCSSNHPFPPTSASCPTLVSTGVRFQRVTTVWRAGHQVRLRDTFTSTNHAAHTVTLQYQAALQNQTNGATATGTIGYAFPSHGSGFHASTLGHVLTAFGSKAASVLIRSDLHADASDPEADTTAATWSRPPSKVNFDASQNDRFGMQYTVKVPAGGKGFLGFAISERWLTIDVRSLTAHAVADMTFAPSITSPHRGATIHGKSTTVKGSLHAGANGLPTSVKVNGHSAHITKTGTTTATYKVTFTESLGRHTITVTARDSVGNSAKSSTTVKNT